jgi:hypothetical protein
MFDSSKLKDFAPGEGFTSGAFRKNFGDGLNGVPVFAKGADWIPADSFVGSLPDERYERLLTSAKDAHMNMLRGGEEEYTSTTSFASCAINLASSSGKTLCSRCPQPG